MEWRRLRAVLLRHFKRSLPDSRRGTNITPRKDSRVVPFIHASRRDTCVSIIPEFIDPVWPRETSPLSGLLFLARGFCIAQ
jgi:hypothetical protein